MRQIDQHPAHPAASPTGMATGSAAAVLGCARLAGSPAGTTADERSMAGRSQRSLNRIPCRETHGYTLRQILCGERSAIYPTRAPEACSASARTPGELRRWPGAAAPPRVRPAAWRTAAEPRGRARGRSRSCCRRRRRCPCSRSRASRPRRGCSSWPPASPSASPPRPLRCVAAGRHRRHRRRRTPARRAAAPGAD
jgi:hypothetical protein